MRMETLHELYVDELKDLYSAERQLVEALPKMAKNATSPELRDAFLDHLEETKGHVQRLEQIFDSLEETPTGKNCKGMEGLIAEGKELLEEDAQEDVRDAGLISKAQHVEHYEMAGYGTVRTYAAILGEAGHVDLLQKTLDEESAADELLTQLAESSINIDAAIGDESSDESRVSRGDKEVTRVKASDRASGRSKSSSAGRRSSSESTPERRDR